MPGERRHLDLYLFVVSVSAAMVLCSCYRFEVHVAVYLPLERPGVLRREAGRAEVNIASEWLVSDGF